MDKPTPAFNNGDIVKDRVTGFQGMVMATTLWLTGCYRYVVVSSTLDKDGKPSDFGFDELQLELVQAGAFDKTLPPAAAEKGKSRHATGGPRARPY